jgi:tRNA threonylcarbamoyladenosine biosynthesis protein TsaB
MASNNNKAQPAILLGLESSGLTCAVGLSKDHQLLAEISANVRNIHSQKLAPFVEEVLEIAGLKATDISAIVLSAGPGSFTGLRIGYSLAKGLAHGLKIPLVEIPTLEVLAFQAGAQTLPIMPVIDAHRGEIFCAIYRWKNGKMETEQEAALLSPAELPGNLKNNVLLTGADAESLFPQLQPFLPGDSRLLQPAPRFPQMWALLELGFQKFRQQQFSDPNSCEPFYLRDFGKS